MHLSSRVILKTWCIRASQKRLNVHQVCLYIPQKTASPSPVLYIGHRQHSMSTVRSQLHQEGVLPPAAVEGEEKPISDKIQRIVDEISGLTLKEVADLNSLLKKTLNISDAPAMMPMGMMGSMPAQPEEPQEEEVATPVVVTAVQTSFQVKLTEYDESKKVALIKEIRSTVEGMNLVQAKKFVESLPQVVIQDVGQEEAETVKKKLEAAGGVAQVE
ncbi:39S ribosomal protein L12, mitochondrial [Lingula anatina]|uniref:Large ribosomal subunit protein bL12m n=1 Tax=Lingula anatina TaxID=7574 RepID=A0A1S3H560_LINAN|nr:39S ribosomal protein L12, mitochondrial [Lingula anatina]|eukprot:XP_013381143.1 39S ribosomal protein L12, mitochondrial [Lingula anatina]